MQQSNIAALFLTCCVEVAMDDMDLPLADRQELADWYAGEAMAYLRQAVRLGWTDTARMQKDLGLLRKRPDFRRLVDELEGKPVPPREPAPRPRQGRG